MNVVVFAKTLHFKNYEWLLALMIIVTLQLRIWVEALARLIVKLLV